MPINLDVSESDINRLGVKPGARIALVDGRDDAALAIITGVYSFILNYFSIMRCTLINRTMIVEDIYKPDLVHEAITVFGADDPAHPAVTYLRTEVNPYYVGGKVQAIQAPTHYDYVSLRCMCPLLSYTPCSPSNRIVFPLAYIQSHLQNFVHSSRNSHGAKSWRSRRAIRCIGLIASSQFAPHAIAKQMCSSIPSWVLPNQAMWIIIRTLGVFSLSPIIFFLGFNISSRSDVPDTVNSFFQFLLTA